MEFKKIDDTKFQCFLNEEDLEDNNISLDDFFRNDTDKIHNLLDVIMQEAEKSIGVILSSRVMSLQLTPQPDHSLMLTISSGQDDFGEMLKQAGERASQAISALKGNNREKYNNVIKKNDEKAKTSIKASEFKPVAKEVPAVSFAVDTEGNPVGTERAICHMPDLDTFEIFCKNAPKTWGIKNKLYKDLADGSFYLCLERGRSSRARFEQFVNGLMEYGRFVPCSLNRLTYMDEHFKIFIPDNAVNSVKKYCNE